MADPDRCRPRRTHVLDLRLLLGLELPVSDRDAFREAQQERRNHGLKARHETREARAVRREVANEIADAIARTLSVEFDDDGEAMMPRDVAVGLAREIGSR